MLTTYGGEEIRKLKDHIDSYDFEEAQNLPLFLALGGVSILICAELASVAAGGVALLKIAGAGLVIGAIAFGIYYWADD